MNKEQFLKLSSKERLAEVKKLGEAGVLTLNLDISRFEKAAKCTLRGSDSVKKGQAHADSGTEWINDGVKHGVLRHDIGNTHIDQSIEGAPSVTSVLHDVLNGKEINGEVARIVYTNSQGMLRLRRAIAAQYGLDPKNIYGVNGVTEGLQFTGLLVSNLKSNVVCVNPVYAPWAGILILYGVEVKRAERIRGGEDNGSPDVKSVLSKLDEHTRAVVVISGDNPTGTILKAKTARQIADGLQLHMLETGNAVLLIIDDIYRDYIPSAQRIDFFKISEETGVPLLFMSGIDKTLGTGFHGGFFTPYIPDALKTAKLVNDALHDALGTAFAMYLGENTLTQYASLPYYEEYETIMKELAPNFKTFANWSMQFGTEIERLQKRYGKVLEYPFGKPEIPFYHYLEYVKGVNSNALTAALVDEKGVCITPSEPFGEKTRARVAMVRPPMHPVNVAKIIDSHAREHR